VAIDAEGLGHRQQGELAVKVTPARLDDRHPWLGEVRDRFSEKVGLRHRVRVDASVGRQILDTVKDLDRLRAGHRLPRTIVLQVGNNGPLWYRDLVELKRALRGVPDVVVVNVRNDTSWQDESNQALVNWLRGWREAHLVDWYGRSTDKMMQDGTHPWPYGCRIYARLIADTLRAT